MLLLIVLLVFLIVGTCSFPCLSLLLAGLILFHVGGFPLRPTEVILPHRLAGLNPDTLLLSHLRQLTLLQEQIPQEFRGFPQHHLFTPFMAAGTWHQN